jgi:hypothetical protein
MRFAVVPMRFHGRALPHAELANRPPWIGELRIEEIRDEQLMRYIRTARVLVLDRPRATEVLGELFEPQIIAMSLQAFTMSGWERVGDQCYTQSWLVRDISDAWSAIGAGGGMSPVRRTQGRD